MNADFTRLVFAVIASILSVPAIVALIRAAVFFGNLERSVTELRTSLDAFTKEVRWQLRDHDVTLGDIKPKVKMMWDGEERRAAAREASAE